MQAGFAFIQYILIWLIFKVLKNEGKSVNIQEVMDQWTLQMGYPVITIIRNETVDDGITVTQEHFLYNIDINLRDLEQRNKRYGYFYIPKNFL